MDKSANHPHLKLRCKPNCSTNCVNLEYTNGGSIWCSSSSVFFFSSTNCNVLSSTKLSKLLAYFSNMFTILSIMLVVLKSKENNRTLVKRGWQMIFRRSRQKLLSESLYESFPNSHVLVKREQELHESWWEWTSESLYESFLNFHVLIKRE